MIKLIIGLGNPGKNFELNRHNVGFMILNYISQEDWVNKKNFLESSWDDTKILKPQTFMNNSGEVLKYFQNINSEEILVIHDELELPFGSIKFKKGGSAKGHNGLKSIINHIGPEFHRLRFGISRPINKEIVPDYVLSNFSSAEQKEIHEKLLEETVIQLNKYKKDLL